MNILIFLTTVSILLSCYAESDINVFEVCGNEAIITLDEVCDGIDNCQDGYASDECNCNDTRFVCAKKCVRAVNLCDGIDDCQDGYASDEDNCNGGGYTFVGSNCNRRDAVKCADDVTCVLLNQLCDGVYDCPDDSDEIFAGPGLKCVIKSSRDVTCTLPQPNLYDVTGQCAQNEDLCFDKNGERTDMCFQCLDGSHIISRFQVCNGILDCSDFSDECLCETIKTKEICQDLYVQNIQPSVSCEGWSENDDVTNIDSNMWIEATIPCGDGTCTPSSGVCDGYYDCDSEADEKYCFSSSSLELIDFLNSNLRKENTSVAALSNRTDTENRKNGTVFCSHFARGSIYANKCDGNPNCDELGIDECLLECEERPPFCDVNITCLWAPQICDGIWQSDVDCGERINEEELNCPGRFYCKNGVSISISITQVCDGVINCDDESDEAVERNCEDGRFYCEVRRNNTDRLVKDAFFVHKNLMFNGRFDCSDGSDECPSTLDTNAFSSRDEMIGSAALKGILWVIAPLALIGNLVVIWTTTKKILKKAKNQISEIHYFMVLNLAIADGLMGVYLIIIAIMSVQFSGKYCYMDKIWRSGQLCRWIGALLVVSTEASVMILLVMGGFRFYTIFRPYGSQFSEKMGIYNKLLILLAWLLSAVLAIVPLILSDFDNLLWVSGVFFVDDTVSKTVFAEYNRKVNELQKLANFTEVVKNITTANGTTLYKSKILPDVMMRGTFGFYSQNSICLPSLFTRPPDPGWQFTVTVITFNFAAFIMMVLFYGLIWKLSSEERDKLLAANVPTGGKLNYKKCKLQARVTRLLFTDFTCWIPICIMSYIHLSGIDISGNAYAICGIVLLPINSALNPLLYAGLLDKAWKKWKQCCKKDNTSQSGEGKNKKGFLERFQLKNSRSNDYEINSEDRPSAEFAATTLTTISGSPIVTRR